MSLQRQKELFFADMIAKTSTQVGSQLKSRSSVIY